MTMPNEQQHPHSGFFSSLAGQILILVVIVAVVLFLASLYIF
jgi:hypothetical protein